MRAKRSLSHTEISTLLSCPAAHDLAYVGQLAGSGLVPKSEAPVLRDGRAWSAAVATWHASGDVMAARSELAASLQRDAVKQKARGAYVAAEHQRVQARLVAMLAHYSRSSPRVRLEQLDAELHVPIPSRSGRGRSNVYSLRSYLAGLHHDDDGRTWLVEFRLRGQLSSLTLLRLTRQARWNAWSWREITGVEPVGVIVDERLAALPKPARILKNGRPSHALDQVTTADLYLEACHRTRTDPDPEALEAYRSRVWQQREPVPFGPGDLDEAGQQLVSCAKLVRLYDTGWLTPVRNPSRARCLGCRFKDICADPSDTASVEALFDRRAPKREHPTGGGPMTTSEKAAA